jgi:hypothetical protein
MAIESPRDRPAATLPAERAFVVHFTAADRPGRRFKGRVEHLTSGASTHFASLRSLLAFFDERLDAPPTNEAERRCKRR